MTASNLPHVDPPAALATDEPSGVAALNDRHAVRNLLAMFRSIVLRSAGEDPALSSFAMHLTGRIDALARIHGKLTRRLDASTDLEELISDEIDAQTSGAPDVVLNGPSVMLDSRSAQTLGLAFHELATNALKFGAFSAPGGQLRVKWTIETSADGARLVHLLWAESGVRAVPMNPARGFGMTYVEEAIAHDLEGTANLNFLPGGLRCAITCPLRS